MSITDKTKKVLWARSGNLCAFCKTLLIVNASTLDSESVVGDESHIIFGAPNGPRHDPSLWLSSREVQPDSSGGIAQRFSRLRQPPHSPFFSPAS